MIRIFVLTTVDRGLFVLTTFPMQRVDQSRVCSNTFSGATALGDDDVFDDLNRSKWVKHRFS